MTLRKAEIPAVKLSEVIRRKNELTHTWVFDTLKRFAGDDDDSSDLPEFADWPWYARIEDPNEWRDADTVIILTVADCNDFPEDTAASIFFEDGNPDGEEIDDYDVEEYRYLKHLGDSWDIVLVHPSGGFVPLIREGNCLRFPPDWKEQFAALDAGAAPNREAAALPAAPSGMATQVAAPELASTPSPVPAMRRRQSRARRDAGAGQLLLPLRAADAG